MQDCKNEYEPPLAYIKGTLRDIIWGIKYAVEKEVKVINLAEIL